MREFETISNGTAANVLPVRSVTRYLLLEDEMYYWTIDGVWKKCLSEEGIQSFDG